ncbi:MAG TPA: PQQ-binding-like beta-propeller repeat protein [Fimbriimonadaceae bacterium]|nr:PQQ-binding-like beta-propeller repeat protein [Fimbriimonadaceae bacterium]
MKLATLLLGIFLVGRQPKGGQAKQSVTPKPADPAQTTKLRSDVLWPSEAIGIPINQAFKGVTCFRGNPQRNYYGDGALPTGEVEVRWSYPILGSTDGRWTGVGWTGQTLIVEWPKEIRKWMNFTKQPGPARELICGALNGYVHFVDADTGKPSRKPLKMPSPYPIKGTVSIDPRGFPLLYVGCGVRVGPKPAFRVFSLLSYKELLALPADDPIAPRKWPGSDSNALILDDTLFLPCENGLFFDVKLNSSWDVATGKLSIKPKVRKTVLSKVGMESSMAVWNDLGYVADNKGTVREINLRDPRRFRTVAELGDDTDSTIVISPNGDLIVGIEKDKRTGANAKGIVFCLKQPGKPGGTFTTRWKWEFQAGSILGAHPVNGGILSTGALYLPKQGPQSVIFTTSHHPTIGRGFVVALDLATGKLRWKQRLSAFAWSSPIVAGDAGFCADSVGHARILSAKTGESLIGDDPLPLGANVEGSPIAWNGNVYVGIRGGALLCIAPKQP